MTKAIQVNALKAYQINGTDTKALHKSAEYEIT